MGMKRVRAAAVTCGLLATGGLAVGVGGTAAQEPTPPTGTLQLVLRDRDVRFQLIDVPPLQGRRQPPTRGDGFLLTGPVRNQAGNRAGRLQAVFVITNVRREQAQVSATFLLRGGHIVASGAETKGRVDNFAVTGGTGRYAGARGTLRVTDRRRTTTFLFTFMS
jgi:hypothetical protein